MAAEQAASFPMKNKIYQAILQRRSVRRYQRKALPEETLVNIRSFTEQVDGLFDDNQFVCEQRDSQGLNLKEIVGSYGQIVNPPHFLVPYLIGSKHSLTDLGFRAEQIVIQLTAMGVGTCYLGTIGRQEQVKEALNLPSNAIIGALVIFGLPSKQLGGRAINTIMHNMTGAENKLLVDKIGFENAFDQPLSPSSSLIPIMEAARRAPSAVNAQPWRLLSFQQSLFLFINRENPRYGSNQDYRYYDAGICMAHISLALQTMNKHTKWAFIDPEDNNLPPYPPHLEPLARMEL